MCLVELQIADAADSSHACSTVGWHFLAAAHYTIHSRRGGGQRRSQQQVRVGILSTWMDCLLFPWPQTTPALLKTTLLPSDRHNQSPNAPRRPHQACLPTTPPELSSAPHPPSPPPPTPTPPQPQAVLTRIVPQAPSAKGQQSWIDSTLLIWKLLNLE